jgi:hypothetical protein
MKPAAPSKPPGRPPSPPHYTRVTLLVRVALVVLMALAAWLILWLTINIFFLFSTANGADKDLTEQFRVWPLPTLTAVVPSPIIFSAGPTGGRGPEATPVSLESVAIENPTIEPPTATPEPPTPEPQPSADPLPPAIDPPLQMPVNGVAWETIIVLPADVIDRSREINGVGQATGRNPRAYSKVGDSTTELPHFLARFDTGPYNLGDYAYLQPAVDHFNGSHSRDSIAVRTGLHAWTANDPAWAPPGLCLPNETPVQCEIRVHNPAVILIRLGTNDVGVPGMFDGNIRQVVETAIANGVLPVIGTKGDRHEGSNENNDILRRIAADYQIPLWDYDRLADTLPGRGLDVDFAHMNTFYAHDYTDPTAFTRGHAMHNLTALMMLDALWRSVTQE